MTAAVIAGSFADYRLVKSRSVLQLVVEIPVEQQEQAFKALGYPLPGVEIAVAVARLNPQAGTHSPEHQERTTVGGAGQQTGSPMPAGEHHQRARYAAMSPAEQAVTRAAMLPKDERFRAWVAHERWNGKQDDMASEHTAIEHIRERCCGGSSRKMIADIPEYLDRFLALETSFRVDVGELPRPR